MPPKFDLHEAFKEKDTPGGSSSSAGPAEDVTSEELGAEGYKKKGNAAFANKDWDEAIKQYNKAISLDATQAAFYSNRAACWSSKGRHENALADADRCIGADPKFVKGHSRKGKALFDLGRLDEAQAAYEEGLKLESSNEACLTGVRVVKAAKAGPSGTSASGSASSSPFSMDGAAKLFESLSQRFTRGGGGAGGGISAKLKMYGVMLTVYFLYTNYMGGKSSRKRSSSLTHDASADDDDGDASSGGGSQAAGRLRRGFADVHSGTWISYLEVPATSETQFLLLHSTASSASAEFGGLLDAFAVGGSAESSGLGLLAPDRPCHGYSPCARSSEGASPAWAGRLLASRPRATRLAIVASGPTAARQAIALSKKRKEVEHVLLMNQRSAAPAPIGAAATAADMGQWLERGSFGTAGGSKPSAAAAADALWWATRAAHDKTQESTDALDVRDMSDGCAVTVFHGDADGGDAELKAALEEQGVTVTMRSYGDRSDLLDELVTELQQIASASDTSSEERVGHHEED